MVLMKKFTSLLLLATLMPSSVLAADSFNTVFGGSCDSYECWIGEVWSWALMILVPLSVLIISAAGVIYMTAGGDEKRVGTAKKMMWGVLSGVGLIILARVLLTNVLGLDWTM